LGLGQNQTAADKFPVLVDTTRDQTVPESTIIIEYLDRHFPGRTRFMPADDDRAIETRLRDRLFDLYVHGPMQRIVGDRLRPIDQKDPLGVAQARQRLDTAYALLDADMAKRTWAAGKEFGLADCAAAPALFYAERVHPFTPTHRHLAAYYDRLLVRPSFARAVAEAKPYFHLFPQA
jgi:glutathione S-transferase